MQALPTMGPSTIAEIIPLREATSPSSCGSSPDYSESNASGMTLVYTVQVCQHVVMFHRPTCPDYLKSYLRLRPRPGMRTRLCSHCLGDLW
jgi:hypothetical protein